MDASTIERVARALAECDGCEDWDRLPEDSQHIGIMTKADWRECARAAIEAYEGPSITEPTLFDLCDRYAAVMSEAMQENR